MRDGFIKVGTATPLIKVGNSEYNSSSIIGLIERAEKEQVKILVFPELAITGYTAGDLFFQRKLQEGAKDALSRIVKSSEGKDMLIFVGYPCLYQCKLYNTAAVIKDGKLLAFVAKENLPNYGEFSEVRWFTPTPEENIEVDIMGSKVPLGNKIIFKCINMESLVVGAEICEDLWVINPPSIKLAISGATVIVNLSASDEVVGKDEYRKSLVTSHSARLVAGYIYADASEGESTTDMVFTGANLIAENGTLLKSFSFSSDSLLVSEIDTEKIVTTRSRVNTFPIKDLGYKEISFSLNISECSLTRKYPQLPFVPSMDVERESRSEKILMLQALGLKKRMEHIKAKCAVIGLSGGLDSTLALLVTVKAFDMLSLDRKGILAITMPCFGTTRRTRNNAELLANALGVSFQEIDIKKSVTQHFEDIGQSLDNHSVTYENGQARERTQVLMDVANKYGGIVIGTGDLSELALGWATYNGDHASMYGVNSGVPKTLVRYLVKHYALQSSNDVASILEDILATPVSPELLPAKNGDISQVTEDIVGPYELHDFFLYYMVRQAFSPRKIYRIAVDAFDGKYDRITIKKWLVIFMKRFFSQQFKRNFLPDGPKVGTVTLSPRSDWKMPSDGDGSLWIKEAESLEV